jgi:hypothetical protein
VRALYSTNVLASLEPISRCCTQPTGSRAIHSKLNSRSNSYCFITQTDNDVEKLNGKGVPSVFGHNLQWQLVRGVNSREECHWSHACKSFKRAGMGTNGILECKLPSKTRSIRASGHDRESDSFSRCCHCCILIYSNCAAPSVSGCGSSGWGGGGWGGDGCSGDSAGRRGGRGFAPGHGGVIGPRQPISKVKPARTRRTAVLCDVISIVTEFMVNTEAPKGLQCG